MAIFEYRARTKEGEARSGVIETTSRESALDTLHKNNLIVVSIAEKAPPSVFEFKLGGGVKQKDIVLFSRQLSTLFEAQIPIVHALRTLASETTKPKFRKAITEIMNDVTGGMALSQAMGKHINIFSAFYVNLIRAGEESGKLQEVFAYLADYLERSYYLTVKARNAMIYPAFVMGTFIAVFTLMLVVVIPKLTSIFKETGQAVPFYTQVVIGVSDVLRNYGFFILAGIILGVIGLWRWGQTKDGKYFFHNFQISVPFFGGLYTKLYITRLTDNLRTLIISGIPLIRALSITGDVVGNVVYQEAIQKAIESVKAGGTISGAFEKSPKIPFMVTQMIKVGETSGRLDFILQNITKFYQREVDSLLENLVSLIEPALIIVLGLGVGLLVAAVLVPLYNLVGGL